MKKTSDAQIKASTKWNTKNKEKMNYIRKKSAAKKFIEDTASLEDLQMLKDLIEKKLKKILKNT